MRVRAVNHVHKYNWEVALANQVEQKAQRHHEGGVVEEEEERRRQTKTKSLAFAFAKKTKMLRHFAI